MSRALNKRQIALLHVGKNKLNMSDAEYRCALIELAGVTSSLELDWAGFELILAYFEWRGFTPSKPRGPNYGERPGMASFAQIELIRALWHEWTQGKGTEDSLNTWLERVFRVSSLRFLKAETAPKVITALKAMKARRA